MAARGAAVLRFELELVFVAGRPRGFHGKASELI